MAKNFKKTGQNIFCTDFLVQGALSHTSQFLKKLEGEVNFEKLWQKKLLKIYKGGAELGQPPYKPELILKMLFLSYLFDISERETERVVNDSISMKAFLGLSLDEGAPDHSSLARFKNRLLDYKRRLEKDILKEIFDEIIMLAQEKGVNLGFTQAIDSTHTIANVNTKKDRGRQKRKTDGGDGKPPRDPDAKWGVKRIKEIKTIEGKKAKVKESYFGYKSHLSVNAKNNIVTSYTVTPMNGCDTHQFRPLMKDDLAKGVAQPEVTIYTADRAYDDGENHAWLNQEKLKDAICLKYIREDEKFEDENGKEKVRARWTAYTAQEEFDEGKSERYTVERVNGCLKKHHSFSRAKYIGLQKMKIQTALTAMAHNLKTLVKLWTGTGLRAPCTTHVS
jgi:transposase, IS5 family